MKGTSFISIPLAYGDYYDEHGNVIYTATSDDNVIKLSKTIDITKEDIKRAEITAYTMDSQGTKTEVPNAYYITGYSGNAENDISTPQVRIEGSFKVADLPPVANADNIESVRNARKDNRIYYTVETTKEVEFTLEHNGQTLYDSSGNPIKVNVPVTISASFDYWDERNECPPLRWPGWPSEWRSGKIMGESDTMTGMDFKLGTTSSETDSPVPAVEIIKYIQTEDGTVIEPAESHKVDFSVFSGPGSARIPLWAREEMRPSARVISRR